MLGQLQMDVDDSITMYGWLWDSIHHPNQHQTQGEPTGVSAKLLRAVIWAIEAQGGSGAEAFAVDADSGCRVFVLLPFVALSLWLTSSVCAGFFASG